MLDNDKRATFDMATFIKDGVSFVITANKNNIHNKKTDMYSPVRVCKKCYSIYMTLRPWIMSF